MRCIRRKYILCVQKLTRSNKFPATGNDKRGCSPANRVDSKIRLINGQLFLSVGSRYLSKAMAKVCLLSKIVFKFLDV